MKEHILVLGGTYFVGRKIVEFLAAKGYEVSVLNRGTQTVPAKGVHQIVCDRNDQEAMKTALKGRKFDYVIDVSWQDVSWVEHFCHALPFDGVKKLVFISSSAVYDVENLSIPFGEEDRTGENKYWTFYGSGKIAAERYYMDFRKDKKTQLLILRPPYIYGEYNYAQRESLIFRQIINEEPVAIPKSNPKLQFIYTEDLAAIIDNFLHLDTGDEYICNVGNCQAVTSRQWVEACAAAAGKTANIIEVDYTKLKKNVREFYPFFDYDNVLDVSKVHALWQEETDFCTGLRRAFHWFLENREKIHFKENVDQTLYEIIAGLSV